MKTATTSFADCVRTVREELAEAGRQKDLSEKQAEESRNRRKLYIAHLLKEANEALRDTIAEEPDFALYLKERFRHSAHANSCVRNDLNGSEQGLMILKEDGQKRDGRALMLVHDGSAYRFGIFDLYNPSGTGYMREVSLADKPIEDELKLLADPGTLMKVAVAKLGLPE